MLYIVATPTGNKTVPVDPANIEAFTGGGLTAEQILDRLTTGFGAKDIVAYLAAMREHAPVSTGDFRSSLTDFAIAKINEHDPDDPERINVAKSWFAFPYWPAVLDPRPTQVPDGDTGRLVGLSEEQREKRFGPAPEPVEWWTGFTEDQLAFTDGVPIPPQDVGVMSGPISDEELADEIREAVTHLNAATEWIERLVAAAFKRGIGVVFYEPDADDPDDNEVEICRTAVRITRTTEI